LSPGNPAYAGAYNNLAWLDWQSGDMEGALRQMTRAMELAPRDPDISWNYEQILHGLGR
jgi:Tfp pilus assembly protein PilF